MTRKGFIKAVLISLCCVVMSSAVCAAQKENQKWVEGEVLVKFKQQSSTRPALAAQSITRLKNKYGVTSVEKVFKNVPEPKQRYTATQTSAATPDLSSIYKIHFSSSVSPEDVAKGYQNDSNVEYAEPNYIYTTCTVPNDPDFSKQWGLCNTGQTGGTAGCDIKAIDAWNVGMGSRSIVIAVVDTGVDYNHVDLKNNMWTNSDEIAGNGIDDDGNGFIDDVRGWDFANNDKDPLDDHKHGTHCAGIIAAEGNNGVGVSGVCWKAAIMPVKFITSAGWGTTEAGAQAIEYAANNGARVISNSWGGGGDSSVIHDAIKYAKAKGALCVFAAGNEYTNSPSYPAYYDEVIAVAATDYKDKKASFSNYGTWVDVSAPGVDVYSTLLNNSYGKLSGTSMACPMVSGLAGLLLGCDSSLTSDDVRRIILTNADSIDSVNPSYAGQLGTGRINAYKSVQNMCGITRVTPYHISQGSHTQVHVYGGGFKEGATITIADVTIESLRVIASSEIVATIAVSATAPVGTRDVVLVNGDGKTATGVGLIKIILANAATYTISGYVQVKNNEGCAGVSVQLTGEEARSTTTATNGYYEFTNLYSGAYAIKPISSLYTFSPSSRTISSLTSNLANQNFIISTDPGTRKWVFNTTNPVYASPALGADGTVYIGAGDNTTYNTYALTPTGTKTWKNSITKSYMNDPSPTIGSDGTLYFGSGSPYSFYALDANGALKWQKSFETSTTAASRQTHVLKFPNGKVIPLGEGGVYLDATAAIGLDGTLYCGREKLMALNPADGTKKWDYDIHGWMYTSPAVAMDGTVYATVMGDDYSGKMYAINPDGTKKWEFSTNYQIYCSPVIGTDSTVYINADYKVYALNSDGTKKWEFKTADYTDIFNGSLVVGNDGTVYATGAYPVALYAINPDGTQKWKMSTQESDLVYSVPVIGADGMIYFATYEQGVLYAINPNGTQQWKFSLGASVESSPVIADDGTLYIGTSNGEVIAINTASKGMASSTWSMFHCDARHRGNMENILGLGSVVPYRVNQGSHTQVHLYGGGFKQGATVTIADVTIAAVTVISKSEIVADITVGATASLGDRDVVLVNGDGKTVTGKGLVKIISADATTYTISGYVKRSSTQGVAGISVQLIGEETKSTTTATNGYYAFTNLYSGAYTITPDSFTYVFSPSSRTITSLTSNVSNQDFVIATGPGTKKWVFTTTDDLYASPALGNDGTVYMSAGRTIYAITPAGTQKWKSTMDSYMSDPSPTIGADGTIYISGGYPCTCYAFDGNGTLKWKTTLSASSEALEKQKILKNDVAPESWVVLVDPTIAVGLDGTLYCGGRKLAALDPSNGAKKWEYDLKGVMYSCPAVGADGTIYTAVASTGSRGVVYAINPDGTKKWECKTSGNILCSPVIGADGAVYINIESKLCAFNPDNGAKKWEFSGANIWVQSCAVGDDGTIYVFGRSSSSACNVYALNPNGTQKWKLDTGEQSAGYNCPVMGADGVIYAATSDNGTVYAINSNGTLQWKLCLNGHLQSAPVIADDGTLYTATETGGVFAINTASKGMASSAWPMFCHDKYHQGRVASSTPQKYTISGYVFDETGKYGIAGATLTLQGSVTLSTRTSATGYYEIRQVQQGDYILKPTYANRTFQPAFQTYTGLNENKTQNFTALAERYTISGYVLDDACKKISGVKVVLTTVGQTAAAASTGTVSAITDGYYEFTDVLKGTYTIKAQCEGYEFFPTSRTIAGLSRSMTDQNFTGIKKSSETFSITGHVNDGAGSGINGVHVYLQRYVTAGAVCTANEYTSAQVVNGAYEFTGIPKGDYVLIPAKDNYAFVPSSKTYINLSQNWADQNFTGTLVGSQGIISGTVYSDIPVGDSLMLGAWDNAVCSGMPLSMQCTTEHDTTNDQWNYSFTKVSTGTYYIAAWVDTNKNKQHDEQELYDVYKDTFGNVRCVTIQQRTDVIRSVNIRLIQNIVVSSATPAIIYRGSLQWVTVYGDGFYYQGKGVGPRNVELCNAVGTEILGTEPVSQKEIRILVKVATTAATGSFDIKVTNPDGNTGVGTARITVRPKITVAGMSPTYSSNAEDTASITINGEYFTSDLHVIFKNSGTEIEASTVTVTHNQIVCSLHTKSATAGLYDVIIARKDGQGRTVVQQAYQIVDAGSAANGVLCQQVFSLVERDGAYCITEACVISMEQYSSGNQVTVKKEQQVPHLGNSSMIRTLTPFTYTVTADDPSKPYAVQFFCEDLATIQIAEGETLALVYFDNDMQRWELLPTQASTQNTRRAAMKATGMQFNQANVVDGTIEKNITYLAIGVVRQSAVYSQSVAGNVYVYPNPYIPSVQGTGVTFTHLKSGGQVRIFTITGERVREIREDGNGTVIWDGKNDDNDMVASGVYICSLETVNGNKIQKLGIER